MESANEEHPEADQEEPRHHDIGRAPDSDERLAVDDTVLQGVKLIDTVPPYVTKLWGKAVYMLLERLMFALGEEDAPAIVLALRNLLLLPSRVLRLPPKGGSSLGSQVTDTIRAYLRQEEIEEQAQLPTVPDKYKRAAALVRQGQLGRACRVLVAQPPADTSDPGVLAKLRALHPPARAKDRAVPSLPDDAGRASPIFDAEQVSKALRQLPFGSAAGPSGWKYDFIKAAAGTEGVLESLAVLLSAIAAGDLPEEAKSLLLSVKLVPLQKQGGGIRPIGVRDCFVRIAFRMLVSASSLSVNEALYPTQLGVATKGALEKAIHTVQAKLTNDEGLSGVRLDFENAFNSVSRSAALRALFAEDGLAPLWAAAHWAYSCPTQSLVFGRDGKVTDTFTSERGVVQGDPLSAALFALAIKRALNAGLEELGAGGTLVAYLDDVFVLGSAASLPSAVNRIRAAAKQVGLEIQFRKSLVLHFHREDLPQAMQTWAQRHNIQIESQAAVAFGAPVGAESEEKAQHVMQQMAYDVVAATTPLLEALMSDRLTRQEAFMLLRCCVVHKFNHLSRCAAPHIVLPAAERFDEFIQQALCHIGGLGPYTELPESAVAQSTLPLRRGGLGLRSAASVVQAAYSAGAIAAAQHMSRIGHAETPASRRLELLRQSVSAQVEVLEARCPKILKALDHSSLTIAATNEIVGAGLNLQHVLTAAGDALLASKLVATADDPNKARLHAVAAPYAASKFRTIPSERRLAISDADFSVALKMHLGLPVADDVPEVCACGDDMAHDHHHGLSCKHLGKLKIARHDQVVNTLSQLMNRVGAISRPEPRQELKGSNKRPDLSVQLSGKHFLIDVTIIHPGASSYVKSARNGQLKAAEIRRKTKQSKYDKAVRDAKAIFVPFVIESYGGFDKEATAFLQTVLKQTKKLRAAWAPKQLTKNLHQFLAVALQQGNGAMLRSSLARAERFGRH